MATDVTVVIAYTDLGDPHRQRAFAFVSAWYARLGWEIVVEAGPKPFSRAKAINAGVRAATGSVIVQSDPDSVVPDEQLWQAINLASAADGLVIPHDRYLYLNDTATAAVMARGTLQIFDVSPDTCDEAGMNGVGNVTVFSRSTWEQVHGLDERFGMWGGDDAALAYACAAYCRPTRRLTGDMVHLYHPRLPQSVPGHPGYVEQMTLLAEYRDAAVTGPAAVRHLVETR